MASECLRRRVRLDTQGRQTGRKVTVAYTGVRRCSLDVSRSNAVSAPGVRELSRSAGATSRWMTGGRAVQERPASATAPEFGWFPYVVRVPGSRRK